MELRGEDDEKGEDTNLDEPVSGDRDPATTIQDLL